MENENASGIDLLSADVGAIYLGSTKSSYTFRNEQGEELANLNSTGMFVRESGGAGHILQMNVERAVKPLESMIIGGGDYADIWIKKEPMAGDRFSVGINLCIETDSFASSEWANPSESSESDVSEPVTQEQKYTEMKKTHSTKKETSSANSYATETKSNTAEKTAPLEEPPKGKEQDRGKVS